MEKRQQWTSSVNKLLEKQEEELTKQRKLNTKGLRETRWERSKAALEPSEVSWVGDTSCCERWGQKSMLGKTEGLVNDCMMNTEILSSLPSPRRQATNYLSSSLMREKLNEPVETWRHRHGCMLGWSPYWWAGYQGKVTSWIMRLGLVGPLRSVHRCSNVQVSHHLPTSLPPTPCNWWILLGRNCIANQRAKTQLSIPPKT